MRRGRKLLIFHLIFFSVLSVIAFIPGGALFVVLITAMLLPLFGIPAFFTIAAPTVLLYSVALVPLWLALTEARRRIVPIAGAAVLPVLVAVGPGTFTRQETADFAVRASKEDLKRSTDTKPRSLELVGDNMSGMLTYGEEVGDKNAACNEVCRRLLFNGEADWVRMTRVPDIGTRSGKTLSATYRIERRTSCPQAYPDGTQIEKAVRDRLINGDCLVVETDRHDAPDAVVTWTTQYFDQSYPSKLPEHPPRGATIVTVKQLRIVTGQGLTLAPVLQQTETVALVLALPFYIGTEMHMQGGYNGATIGRDKIEAHSIDLAQTLRDTFGYRIAEISAPPPEDPKQMAERILGLPPETSRTLSAQQQDAIKDVLTGIRGQPSLSDANVDFIRRVIADKRITEGQVGIPLQDMFRKFTARLEPLIPVVVDRLTIIVPQRDGHYQSMLGWSLVNYSADSLRPYRDGMIAIAEKQADWVSTGVLTRLAELGSDKGVDLVIKRLDSDQVRQFAAVAACRASDDAWSMLEPAVLAHLAAPRRSNTLQDEEGPLMLALVRHGKKSVVIDMVECRDLFNKQNTFNRLARFEQGFAPEQCRHL